MKKYAFLLCVCMPLMLFSQEINKTITLDTGEKIHLSGDGSYNGRWEYVVEFISVVDALRLKVRYAGKETILPVFVREIRAPKVNQPLGAESKAWTERYMKQPGIKIEIVQDSSETGNWISLSNDGLVDFQIGILKAGLAWIPPELNNFSFLDSQDAARANLRGVWNTTDTNPPWIRYK
jgi:endonuclease YncB( thermonuclease family)